MTIAGIQAAAVAGSASHTGHILRGCHICGCAHAVPAARGRGVGQVLGATVLAAVHSSSAVVGAAAADVEGAVAVGVVGQICCVAAAERCLQLDLCTAQHSAAGSTRPGLAEKKRPAHDFDKTRTKKNWCCGVCISAVCHTQLAHRNKRAGAVCEATLPQGTTQMQSNVSSLILTCPED